MDAGADFGSDSREIDKETCPCLIGMTSCVREQELLLNPFMRALRSSCRAFTRIDLIASVSIIGLVGLLMPLLLGAASGTSQAARCIENFRKLSVAEQMYAADNAGFLPANRDDGSTLPQWVVGSVTIVFGATNDDFLINPKYAQLAPYVPDVKVYHCPADRSTVRAGGQIVPRNRSVSMNLAVGTVGGISFEDPKLATPGSWLDNNHAHTRDAAWRTYARFDEMVDPIPSKLAVFIDEDEDSINDGLFAFGMARAEWIDWPSTRHDTGGTLGFADGHVEIHHWVDPRTPVVNHNVARRVVPDSPDYAWMRERISARIAGR